MIYQKNIEKFESRWRNSFQIQFQDDRDVFYSLQQLNDQSIKRTFHDNHLKFFIFRIDHLASSSNISLSNNQIILLIQSNVVSTWSRDSSTDGYR
jgi:hypothetical protein